MAQAVGEEPRFSEHYKRLQRIEQRVVQAVQIASQVMAELAKAADADKGRLVQLASDFMQQIQEAQQQLLAAVRGAVSERSFEASVYHHMATATVTLEQLAAADQHLRGLQRLLSRARRRDAAAAGGALAAGGGTAGGGGGGAEDDALMFDGEGADALP